MGFKTKEEEKAYNREYYKKHREEIIAHVSEWASENKEKISEYHKEYAKKNKEKKRAYDIEYRNKNAEKLKNKRIENTKNGNKYRWFRQWFERNREYDVIRKNIRRTKILQNGGHLSRNEWEEIKKKYEYRCVRCLEKKRLTIDHVLPVSKGGRTEHENTQPLCKSCNSSKKDKHIDYRKDFWIRLKSK